MAARKTKSPKPAPKPADYATSSPDNRVPDSARHPKGSRTKMNRGKFY